MAREIVSRYEAKYLVTEPVAAAIRDWISGVCSPDRHAGPDGRYVVNNLYLDTPGLRFYHDTRSSQYTRFKPRVRFYGDRPDPWLWIELKHKVRAVTWKVRRRVPADQWPGLLEGPAPTPGGDRPLSLADSFEDAVLRFDARPVLQVQYVREPYVSDVDDYGRVTFDRRLSCRRVHGSHQLGAPEPLACFDDPATLEFPGAESPVILEIKTDVRVPRWVLRLIEAFDLRQSGFSKYCRGLEFAMAVEADDRVARRVPRSPVPRAWELGALLRLR